MPLFVGEAAGARVIQTGTGLADVTTGDPLDVLFDATTHPLFPAGGAGTCLFRFIDVEIRHDTGFAIGITPIVDGIPLVEQFANAPPPVSGATAIDHAKARFAQRGTSIAARVRMTKATGSMELADMAVAYTVLRSAP